MPLITKGDLKQVTEPSQEVGLGKGRNWAVNGSRIDQTSAGRHGSENRALWWGAGLGLPEPPPSNKRDVVKRPGG